MKKFMLILLLCSEILLAQMKNCVSGLVKEDDSTIYYLYDSTHLVVRHKSLSGEKIVVESKDSIQLSYKNESEIEALPIVMYDTDVGFGYGAKAFFLNQLKINESFDLILFNSTKGERWYRFVISIPDFELRQQKIFPFAFDLIVDYDKMIKNSFFGVGSQSQFENREYYTKEPVDISLNVGRGFTQSLVGQLGFRYKSIKNYNFDPEGRLIDMHTSLKSDNTYYTSSFINLRFDTRNSFINPSNGFYASGEIEFANLKIESNVNFIRWSSILQYYKTIWYPKTIFALRIVTNNVIGNNLPIQILLPVGGTNTLRGAPIDRYLDKSTVVANAEIRFPIFWRLGGLIALDAGKVFSSFSKISIKDWEMNPTFGLRLYMDTFVVRIDIGLGRETTGFYFNFGQLF